MLNTVEAVLQTNGALEFLEPIHLAAAQRVLVTFTGSLRAALAGEHPIPQPLIKQLACCLYASGYCGTLPQAKAIATVRARMPQAV